MLDNSTVVNINSLYSDNVVRHDDAAAVYGMRWCDITNVRTIFEDNIGVKGIIMLQNYGSIINNASTFR